MSVTSACLPTAIPSARQLAFQDWEFGLFLHFGLWTFNDRHEQLKYQPMDVCTFNPPHLDCDQWIRTGKEAGMRYAVLTAKHHDGFCNWPTQHTDYSVASTPWKDGCGDVVAEFTEACHRHGMKSGLYYSPFDEHCPFYADERAYDDYFIGHLRELLTNYGQIDILWFDGCAPQGSTHRYDWPRIVGEIRRLQPEVCIFNMGDPDFRWVGTEAGIAPRPVWNTVDAVPESIYVGAVDRFHPRWLPAECDCMIRYDSWFFRSDNAHTIKTLEQLIGLYYYSVGRGCNLLLNLGPTPDGTLHPLDAARLQEFGAEIRRRFGTPLATLADCTAEGNGWVWTAAPGAMPTLVDHVVLQEELAHGEHFRRFHISILPEHYGDPVVVYEGENIGHKAICRFPAISTKRLRVEITEADGPAALRAMELHYIG